MYINKIKLTSVTKSLVVKNNFAQNSSRACLPHLIESKKSGKQPHILNISPPLSMKPIWFKNHTAYTIAKYGMSMCVLGMSPELQDNGIAVNALWPRTGKIGVCLLNIQ